MLTVTRVAYFDSAHHLPNYDGKCSNVHGHTYRLEVSVGQEEDSVQQSGSQQGMVVDFHDIDSILKTKVLDVLDHKDLNTVSGLDNPTAENIVLWIKNAIESDIVALSADPVVLLYSVRVWEGEKSYATWQYFPPVCEEVRNALANSSYEPKKGDDYNI